MLRAGHGTVAGTSCNASIHGQPSGFFSDHFREKLALRLKDPQSDSSNMLIRSLVMKSW